MKIVKISGLMLWSLVVLATLTQCRKEAVLPTQVDPVVPPVVTPIVIPNASEVNTFVWSNMHDYYLWNDKVPNLTNTYYQMLTSTSSNYQRNKDSLNVYLNKFSDPSKLFNDLLYQYKVVDKWSFIVSDYSIIDNWIAGISKTMGYDYQLYYLNSTSADIIGVVRYVLKGSPADLAGVQRGDIFAKVDGVQLTDANYTANLVNKESFTLTFAKIVNGVITPTGKTASMTAVQLQEDPVYLNKVIDVNGAKVGYLVYNGFTSDFDLELNTVFQQFKTAGVSKIILDLRYNGGGSVQSAIYMASMIYTTNTSTLFTKSVYNGILTPYITTTYGASFFNSNFADKINTTAINTLNLKDIYFIVSGETASASELLINGLKPYMNVKLFGLNTYGKYVASLTLKDYDANNNLVTTHKYAMQPIVAKYANSLGVSDFVTGLVPDVNVDEKKSAMLQLGDENEYLLKTVLDYIKGLKSQRLTTLGSLANSRSLVARKDLMQFSRDMYVDPQKLAKRSR
ncbi:MAG: S41 family peptidase [Prolixibacteraceae bacterium]|jgi:C-terminal processing protease CtpA/Prc|nr:S41 family peptidase [Prolixibacteraceae bacterium]